MKNLTKTSIVIIYMAIAIYVWLNLENVHSSHIWFIHLDIHKNHWVWYTDLTLWNGKEIVFLQPLKGSHLSIIPKRFYMSHQSLKTWLWTMDSSPNLVTYAIVMLTSLWCIYSLRIRFNLVVFDVLQVDTITQWWAR